MDVNSNTSTTNKNRDGAAAGPAGVLFGELVTGTGSTYVGMDVDHDPFAATTTTTAAAAAAVVAVVSADRAVPTSGQLANLKPKKKGFPEFGMFKQARRQTVDEGAPMVSNSGSR